MTGPAVAVLGEALIDFVESGDDEPRLARPGGSPYNVAIGLARLGRRAAFVGRLSHDPLGTILRNHALRSGVDLSLSVDALDPTTVALVELVDGVATYQFGVEGTADFRWTDAELARVPDSIGVVHFGSLASWTPPGDAAVRHRVAQLRETALVTYDPNVRPHLQPDRDRARAQIEQSIVLPHLVKTSEEDVAWLYPGTAPDEVAKHWLTLGPSVVVVTHGGEGCAAHTAATTVTRPARPIRVVDTVGAGDAFMSGLLDGLLEHDVASAAAVAALGDEVLGAVLDNAAAVAAFTCERAGANPPRRAELDAYLA